MSKMGDLKRKHNVERGDYDSEITQVYLNIPLEQRYAAVDNYKGYTRGENF